MGMNLCNEAGFSPSIIFETTNWNTINALIAAGMGVGFVPEVLYNNNNVKNKPVYYRIVANNTTRLYLVAYKKGTILSTIRKDFINMAREMFQQSVYSRNCMQE